MSAVRSSSTLSRKDQKRQKFEEKKEKALVEQRKLDERQRWVDDNAAFAVWVTDPSVPEPALEPYKNLKEGGENDDSLFVAEGTETVKVLLTQMMESAAAARVPMQLESILLKPSLFFDEPVKLQTNVEAAVTFLSEKQQSMFKVMLANEKVLSEISGFQTSRGCVACGRVPQGFDEDWLMDRVRTSAERTIKGGSSHRQLRLLAVDGVSDTANLGSLIRTASALHIDVLILSHDACDPWYRRSVRVSMGHIARVPIVRVPNLANTLRQLDQVACFAAVVQQDLPCCLSLGKMQPGDVPRRWCCVVGNEGNGVSEPVIAACTHAITIEMDAGVDSLSLPVAAGILLHGLREKESTS